MSGLTWASTLFGSRWTFRCAPVTRDKFLGLLCMLLVPVVRYEYHDVCVAYFSGHGQLLGVEDFE